MVGRDTLTSIRCLATDNMISPNLRDDIRLAVTYQYIKFLSRYSRLETSQRVLSGWDVDLSKLKIIGIGIKPSHVVRARNVFIETTPHLIPQPSQLAPLQRYGGYDRALK